ncbi:hypothetical protein [Brevibacterium moorei]|uniref:hypothetical protein n=1 Tax=Brevibacterium moorei TaxID=2968457 RepID=UPI00211C211C|nr:hypothetical protein [Brevibacterium sp. 68QC2CO]MCQ9385741.1 hypothetical protein [Brevibacterium sp. 68QC2CO]
MYRVDIIKEALGDLPDESFFIGNSFEKNDDILNRVLDVYDKYKGYLPDVSEKKRDDYRPAFVSDYINPAEDSGRGDHELAFARRALLYSDSLGVRDRMGEWSKMRAAEGSLPVGAVLGDQEFPNGVADLAQVVRFAELEESGLLQYFSTPMSGVDSYIDEARSVYVKEPNEDVEGLQALRNIREDQQRILGLSELFKTLDVVGNSDGKLDLYMPEWTLPEFTLEWLLDSLNLGFSLPGIGEINFGALQSHREVMELPAPGIGEFERLTPAQLVEFRQSKFSRRFRDDIAEVAHSFSNCSDGSLLKEESTKQTLRRQTQKIRSDFLKDYGKFKYDWRSSLKENLVVGLVGGAGTAGAASHMGLDVLTNSILAGIPAAAQIVSMPLLNALKWLMADNSSLDVADVHYRVFIQDSGI